MSRKEKLFERFRSMPKDFTWEELISLLNALGYYEVKRGKTAGSRRAFIQESTKHVISLHQPHPGNILKEYQMKDVKEALGW